MDGAPNSWSFCKSLGSCWGCRGAVYLQSWAGSILKSEKQTSESREMVALWDKFLSSEDLSCTLNFLFYIQIFWGSSKRKMDKAVAPHSSALAWKIPWMEEAGGLQSMGSLGVGHNWATSLSLFTFMHWRRKWQPTPVFLPGESQGQGSLVGYHLWGRTE